MMWWMFRLLTGTWHKHMNLLKKYFAFNRLFG